MGRRALVATSTLVLVSLGAGVSYAQGWSGLDALGTKTTGKQADGSYLMQTNQFVTLVGDVIQDKRAAIRADVEP
jgi:hypothetical protein